MAPFLVNAILAGVGLAILSAPLGCLVVWRRMAYMGETIAQAGLIGVAAGLLLDIDQTAATLAATALAALSLGTIARRAQVPLDSILGLLAHGLLAVGVIATTLVKSGSVDLMGYLFGDILAVTRADLMWVGGGGAVALGLLAYLWQPLLLLSVNEELAAAEGVARDGMKTAFVLVLALAVAVSIKVVGVLLAVAFLIMPAVAARPFAATPERMAVLAAVIGVAGVLGGLGVSFWLDVPGGPAIVLVLAVLALSAVTLRPAGRAR